MRGREITILVHTFAQGIIGNLLVGSLWKVNLGVGLRPMGWLYPWLTLELLLMYFNRANALIASV